MLEERASPFGSKCRAFQFSLELLALILFIALTSHFTYKQHSDRMKAEILDRYLILILLNSAQFFYSIPTGFWLWQHDITHITVLKYLANKEPHPLEVYSCHGFHHR